MNPLSVSRNDYHKNKKNSTVYTPVGVADFLFEILKNASPLKGHTGPCGGGGRCRKPFHYIFDPSIGTGRLTAPWHATKHYVVGCDIKPNTQYADKLITSKFEDLSWSQEWPNPDLVLCNPPFNGAQGKRLYPEVFLERIFDLFGPKTPVVLFSPMGLLLNQRRKSKRWRWLRDCGAEITSIISLPLDTFEGVEFHSEILIFNVRSIKPHYFLPEKNL